MAFGHPGVPDRVHFPEIAHVVQPDHDLQELALVRTNLGQKRVDLVEAILCLLSDACIQRADLSGEVNGVAVLNDLFGIQARRRACGYL